MLKLGGAVSGRGLNEPRRAYEDGLKSMQPVAASSVPSSDEIEHSAADAGAGSVGFAGESPTDARWTSPDCRCRGPGRRAATRS